MAIPWEPAFMRKGELSVHNKAGTWKGSVEKARLTFNGLGYGVNLVDEKEEKKADIIVVLWTGSETIKHSLAELKTNFDATQVHGKCITLYDPDRMVISGAGIFLPGKIKNVTEDQQLVIIIHEFLHAAGLNGQNPDKSKDPNDDHDIEGVMTSPMQTDGKKMKEYLQINNAAAMPPIRTGPKTLCKIRTLWVSGHACPKK